MFLGGWGFSLAILALYIFGGIYPGTLSTYLLPLLLIALVGALVETLPLKDIDNITITLSALITGQLLLV